MLAVEVKFLTGRYVATQYNDRTQAEWPPEPARLYSALVDTWAADEDPEERGVLEWLANQAPPSIACSDATHRLVGQDTATHYVPINDTTVLNRDVSRSYRDLVNARAALAEAPPDLPTKARAKLHRAFDKATAKVAADSRAAAEYRGGGTLAPMRVIPELRPKQARTFPSVTPEVPEVTFVWDEAQPSEPILATLDTLVRRVSRLGHSSSLVSCSVTKPVEPTYVPDAAGPLVFRVPAEGQLAQLQRLHEEHRGVEPRALSARLVRYRASADETSLVPVANNAGRWVVLEVQGRAQLPVTRTLDLARAVRSALMAHGPQPVPELISGHLPATSGDDTEPTTRPHLGVLPLPFVGHPNADGSLLGVALMLPSGVDGKEEEALFRALANWHQDRKGDTYPVFLRGGKEVHLDVGDVAPTRSTLRREVWARPSREWVTVTPIALDRNPGDLWRVRPGDGSVEAREAAARRRVAAEARARETIRRSCVNLGLPAPVRVEIGRDPFISGSRVLSAFPPYRAGLNSRVLVHATLQFEAPVAGPLVIGAGRFLGHGLCRPVGPGPVERGMT